jgi:hypothetical protein
LFSFVAGIKKSKEGTTQLVKTAVTLTPNKLDTSFWTHLKANEMQFPMRHHIPRFNKDMLQGHMLILNLELPKRCTLKIFLKKSF